RVSLHAATLPAAVYCHVYGPAAGDMPAGECPLGKNARCAQKGAAGASAPAAPAFSDLFCAAQRFCEQPAQLPPQPEQPAQPPLRFARRMLRSASAASAATAARISQSARDILSSLLYKMGGQAFSR